MKQGPALADGVVEVKFKPLTGREDQAGGIVWRWKDGENYYVARANALENNISLYYTERGSRSDHQVCRRAGLPGNAWHTLRAEFKGTGESACSLGRLQGSISNWMTTTSAGSGAVGVWTKADSVTAVRRFRLPARTVRCVGFSWLRPPWLLGRPRQSVRDRSNTHKRPMIV